MTDVEQKVVQMRFDDKDFDEKAQKTMKTLDKLANKLSFDEVAKKSDAAFKEVADNVEKIADQAYTIIDRVIDKIKDSIATNIFNFLSDTLVGQVKSGWHKYADMTKAVGTLAAQGHNLEEINESLERLSFFSDETSYNFNKMLDTMGKFTAAGVKLSDAEQALEGIASMAGLAGVGPEKASMAMDQLAQAVGSFLKKADWQSIANANLDTTEFRQTLIDTGVALGTLKKVSDNSYKSLNARNKAGAEAFSAQVGFIDSLTNGAWVTTDVMIEAYKKYGAAVDKIYQLTREKNILAGEAVDEIKQNNSELLALYMQQYKVTKEVAEQELNKINSIDKATEDEIKQYAKLKKVSEKVAAATLNENYNNMLKDWQKRTHKTLEETERELDQWGGWVNSTAVKAFANSQEARTFEDVINSVKEAVSSNWRSIYTSIFGDYAEAKALWTDMSEGLINLFAGRLEEIAGMFRQWKEDGGRTKLWQGLYAFGYGMADLVTTFRQSFGAFISEGEEGGTVLMSIAERIQEAGVKFYIFMQKLIKANVIQDIGEAFRNIKSFIDSVFGAFYDGVRDAVPTGEFFLGLLKDFASVFKELTSNFKLSDTALDGLRRTFKGLTIILNSSKKTLVQILVKIVLPLLNAVFEVLGNIIEVVLTITGTIGDIIEYFIPLNSESSALVTILEVLTDVITTLVKLIGNGVVWALQRLVPIIGVVIGSVVALIDSIKELFTAKKIKMGGDTNLMKGFDGLKNKILEAWAPLKSFSEIIDQYKDGKGLINFLNLFADITDGIGNRLMLTIDATLGFLEVMSESKFGKALTIAVKALRYVVKAGLWLFNNLFLPIIKEIITELGMTIESLKGIIDERGILGLLDVIQEVFKTGIFGSLVNTINLINSVIGGNGIGKLFSKGAKALDSIASYFNAAKMDAAANVMLKIVAALTLLYTLLALITFLPVDRYDKMKEAMVDLAIALGVVVGGVFVISAAAALAGGNLIAMAAGFIGVAVAIATALWALKKMVAFIEEVDEDIINKGTEKLMKILDQYSWFLLKTIGPMALVAGKFQGDIGGVGIAMAGLAASIYILIKSLQQIDTVNVDQLDKLFEFLSGIYAVLAASTALMVLAARGQTVHGISIAIASVGVAFAAIKMIYPLCKDVVAEKDVFEEGKEALLVFGGFMVAFAAAMYFVTSGVKGVISGIAAILLFKAFINIVSDQIIPMIKKIIEGIATIASTLNSYNFTENKNWVAFASVLGAFLVLLGAIVLSFRWILGLWSEFDPLSAFFIAATVIGTLLLFAEKIVPAIERLNSMVKKNTDIQNAELFRLVLYLFLPVIAIMAGFALIIDDYVDMYNKAFKNNKLMSINIGLVAKEFNGAASVMQSVMLAIVGLYAAMAALVLIITKANITEAHMNMINAVLGQTFAIVLAILVPLVIMFTSMAKNLNVLGDTMAEANKIVGVGTLGYRKESTMSVVFRSISNTITILAVMIPIFMSGLIGLSLAITKYGNMQDTMKLLETVSEWTLWIIGALGVFALILELPLLLQRSAAGTALEMSNGKTQIDSIFGTYNSFAKNIGYIVLGVVAMMTILTVEAMTASSLSPEKYKQFVKTMGLLTGILLGVIIAMAGFVLAVSWMTNKYSKGIGTFAKGDGMMSLGYFTPTANILIAMVGVVGSLIAIGAVLLPAVKQLETMDISKMVTIFTQIILLIVASMIPMIAISAMSQTDVVNKFGGVISLLKLLVAMAGPLLLTVLSLNAISTVLNAMHGVTDEAITNLKHMVIALVVLVAVAGALGLIAGAVPQFTAGIAVVGFLLLSIGAMALMMSIAAEKIYEIYKDWTGITNVIGKIGQLRSQAMADGQVKGIEDNTDAIIEAQNNQNEAIEKADAKFWGRKSPDKKTQGWGKWLDLGLAKGIKDHTKEVKRAIDGTAKVTSSVFEEDLEIDSPSKVFYKNGRFIVAGLQEGITSQKTSLADTMSNLGDTLANSIQSGFDNANIDLFGGKDFSEWIKEQAGDLDAGSIVGKMLGLDQPSEADAALIEKYQNELDTLNKKFPYGPTDPSAAQRMDWLKVQIDQLSNKSLGTKIGDKISGLLKSDTVKNLVSDGAKALGIEITDAMTSEEVLDSLGKRILGEEGDRTVVGEMFDKVSSGDWVGLGASIGSGIINGMGAVLKEKLPEISAFLSRINPFDTSDVDDYFRIKNLEGGLTVWESYSDAFANFEGKAGKAMFKFSKSFDDYTAEEVLNAINIDYANRMKEFAVALDNAKVWDEYTKTWIYHIDESCEAAIKELFEKWGIASPSKVSTYAYEMVGEGGVNGIKEYTPKLVKAMQDQTSEEYKTMSLGLQALDELASGETVVQPRLVPIIDTASMAAFTGITDAVSGVNGAKISASLDYSGSFSFLAAGQAAIVSAVDAMKRDLLNSLSLGELIKVDVNSTVNDNNLFDHFVSIDRQEYNRTGRHAW